MTEGLPRIERTEVDGVRTFWMDAGDGPFVASLSFRAGRADEPAPRGGISHLVEHLVLAPLGVQDYDHNGFVDGNRTVFHSLGSVDDARAFLDVVTRGLADPGLDRLALERRILRDEAAQNGPSIGGAVRWYRFGLSGHGLVGEDELGLGWLGPEPVREWIRSRFTRDNAVLWLSGPPPADLRLPLPDGPRFPPPTSRPVPGVQFPAHMRWDGPAATITFLVPRRPESNMVAYIAHRRARQRLRFETGLVYDVAVDYDPLDGESAHVTLGADCPEDRVVAVRDALLAVVDELAADGPTEAELAAELSAYRRGFQDRDGRLGFLDASALDELFGRPHVTAQELIERREAVTPATAAATLREGLDTLFVLASGEPLPESRARPYPAWSSVEVSGREFVPAGLRLPGLGPKERLIVGPEGVTVRLSGPERLTVRYADCVAAVHISPTARLLLGSDGFRVLVDAAQWKHGAAAVAEVDAALGPEAVACDEHAPGALAEPSAA